MLKNSPIHPDLCNALALLGDIPADATTAQECWKSVAPPCPPGKTYARWSFWGVLHAPVIVRQRRIDRVFEYISSRQRRAEKQGTAWPPKALFVPVRAVPQPLDGKE